VTVWLRGGTYYLAEPLIFRPSDSGSEGAPVSYAAYPGERVTLSGGVKLDCRWEPYQGGIWFCKLPSVFARGLAFDQLFVNGVRQVRARYPNADASDPRHYSGYIQAAGEIPDEVLNPDPGSDDDMTFSGAAPRGIRFDPATFSQKKWRRPEEAIIHIYQAHYWGNLQWRVRAIDRENRRIWFGDGGQQMGAKWAQDPCVVNAHSRFFVENVFEELDSPGEWYLDQREGLLYFYPEAGLDLSSAVIEAPLLDRLVEFRGTQAEPVHHIHLEGLRFTHTSATFLQEYIVPSLSDWSIHCGGAVYLEGARGCSLRGCFFDSPGGNALFLRNYNRDHHISDNLFVGAGDSAVCLVGALENTVGTQRSFPYACRIENNRIHDCGVFGKQVAGVYISRAKRITVGHNEIYRMPRAGICIGDGTWGGHVIEYNRIYDTCRETGDHGPFNAWGRDKYWCLAQSHQPYIARRSHDIPGALEDAMETVVIRHNYFQEESGWGLDLDDGASNYEIYKNCCVGVSMKLREGAHRTIFNNIWVNGANSPCFHVGNENNHDRYFRNITVMSIAKTKPEDDLNFEMGASYGEIYTLIAPPAFTPWLEEIDYNCFYSDLGHFTARVQERAEGSFEDTWRSISGRMEKKQYSLQEWRDLGYDRHSIFADPLFVDADHGDYRLKPESPALRLGFQIFDPQEAGLEGDFHNRWKEPA